MSKKVIQNSVLRIGGQTVKLVTNAFSAGNWRNAKSLPGQEKNWNPLGVVNHDTHGKVFSPLSYESAWFGDNYYTDGDIADTTLEDGKGSDGRSLLYTDTGCTDLTFELDVLIADLSHLPLAVPDILESINHNPPRKISAGGVWYTGNKTVGALISPAVCIVTSEDYRTENYGLVIVLEPEYIGVSNGASTQGAFFIKTLGNGSTSQQSFLMDGPNPYQYSVANSDMPVPGETITYRVVVSGNLLNVYVDGLRVGGSKQNNVHIFSDAIIPEGIVDSTRHGVFSALPTKQEFSLGESPLGFAPVRFTPTQPPVISKITIENGEFIHNGKPWKAVGLQGLGSRPHEQEVEYYEGTGPITRDLLANYMKGGTNEWSANFYRLYVHLFAMVKGSSLATMKIEQEQLDNLIYWVEQCRDNGMHVMLCNNCVWIPDSAPAWYDALSNEDRWEVQKFQLEQVALAMKNAGLSDVILAYELISEPAIREDSNAEWYQGGFAGYKYVPTVARGISSGNTSTVARNWAIMMRDAIKVIEPTALVTIGCIALTDGNGRPNLLGPFAPPNMDDILDFHSPHISPKVDVDVNETIQGCIDWANSTANPVVIGENWSLTGEQKIIDFARGVGPVLNGLTCFFLGWDGNHEMFPDDVPPYITDTLAWAFQKQHLVVIDQERDYIFFSTT